MATMGRKLGKDSGRQEPLTHLTGPEQPTFTKTKNKLRTRATYWPTATTFYLLDLKEEKNYKS